MKKYLLLAIIASLLLPFSAHAMSSGVEYRTPDNFTIATSGPTILYFTSTSTVATSSVAGPLTNLARTGASTYLTFQHAFNFLSSAGKTTGGTITNAGSGAAAIAAGTSFIRAADNTLSNLTFNDFTASSTVNFPSATSTLYVGVEYNSGSPRPYKETTDTADLDTKFPLGIAIRESGTVYAVNAPFRSGDIVADIIERFDGTKFIQRDERLGGLIVSNCGTRNVCVTTGQLMARFEEFAIAAIDTSVSGSFNAYYRDGSGGWTKETTAGSYAETQWDNTKYDDGDGTLGSMTALTYASRWWYLTTDGSLVMLYGQNNLSSLSLTLNEAPPSAVPDRVGKGGILIGRFIIQTSAATPDTTQSAFGTAFTSAVVTSHANLSSLAWTSSGHTGTASTFAGFDSGGAATAYTEANYLLAAGTRALTGNWDVANFDITGIDSASTTATSVLNTLFVGRTATTTIKGDNQASTLPYASTTALSSSGSAYFGTTAGRVAVGTTSPLTALHITGSSGGGNQTSNVLTLQRTDSTNPTARIQFLGTGGTTGNKWGFITDVGGANNFAIQYKTAGNDFTDTSGFLGITTAGNVLIPSGSAGIGTSTPAKELSVQGSALISGDITSVANVTATGTLTVAGTGTSTFAGPIRTTNIAASSQASGCAQFGAGGYITSTGSACAGSSSGKTVDYYAATSSQYAGPNDYVLATTTSMTFPGGLMITAFCGSRAGGGINLVVNTDQGTTTLAYGRQSVQAGDGDKYAMTLVGLYVPTSTPTYVKISFTDSSDVMLLGSQCGAATGGSANFNYIRFSN